MLPTMIVIDDIVFNQKQLDDAVDRGCRNICLCDNAFILPCADNTAYMAIGNVYAVIHLRRDRCYNIKFDGFEPTVIYTDGHVDMPKQDGEYFEKEGESYFTPSSRYFGSGTASSAVCTYHMSYRSSGSACSEYVCHDGAAFLANGYGLELI